MLITKPGVLALLCMTSAYASAAGCMGAQKTSKEPLRGGIAEFCLTRYDGRELEGRLLVGATYYDPLVIDAHLNEYDDVLLEKVRACGTTKLLPYENVRGPVWESNRRRRIDKTVTVEKDEWHGADVYFPLFDRMWPWPDCWEADLGVLAADGRIVARLPIRVERTDKPPALSDGGAPAEPKPPAPDAGAP
jgi:hypothetical protein